MPARATLYNIKGDALFEFGTGPRNEVQYNPRGDILCICGFGNLRGNVEFWISKNSQQRKQKPDMTLGVQFTAEDTTLFRWSPDGRHFASATTAPRLRVNNGYKIWDASGQVIFEHKTPAEQEMWEVAWRPVPVSAFPEVPLDFGNRQQNAGGGNGKGAAQGKQQVAYVPPHLRGVPNRPAFKLHDDDEPADSVKDEQQNQDANLSKQALKNRKRRELAKTRPPLTPGTALSTSAGAANSSSEMAPPPDAETQKKKKGIMKKLEQIAALKQKRETGEKLEANQLEKIQKEDELLKELEDLDID
jgi:translation initiation factor 2A